MLHARQVDHRDPPAITPEQYAKREQVRYTPAEIELLRGIGNPPKRVRDAGSREEWKSVSACARALKITPQAVAYAVKHQRPLRGGRVLEYVTA